MMSMRRSLSPIAAVLAMACVALAQQSNTQSTKSTPSSPGQQQMHRVNPSNATPEEDRITREVRHQLLMLPYYSVFDDLKFSVQGNTVVLQGSVINPSTKADAEGAVKHIEGVERVDNRIDILPPSSMDDGIRRAEYRAIFGENGLFRYGQAAVPSIHIIVKNGRVTLEGVVDNESDKNLANIRANGVPGVFSVTNNLQVVSTKDQK
jgi:hyperosmotically inducible periplasmic protein